MTTLFKNANIVLEEQILQGSALLIDGERIAAIGDAALQAKADRVIDAKGLYLAPGFVDIHVHGGGDTMFYEDPAKTAEHFIAHGETTQMPTLYYNLTPEEFADAIRAVQAAMATERYGKIIPGFYMEGPYMNPLYGGNPDRNRWKGTIKKEDYQELLALAGKDALVWAVAPEREGIAEFMADAKKANPDTIFAMGHCEAAPEQIEAIRGYGLSIMTHCFNATERPPKRVGTRGVGPDEYCLADEEMYAELICDSGAIHVPAILQKILLKTKGIDKIVLISDSFVSDTQDHPDCFKYPDLSFDHNGLLSGSKLTMDVACKNFIKHTGATLPEAFKAAALNPAKAVGLADQYGSIAEGKIANLILCDETIGVRKIMLYGEII